MEDRVDYCRDMIKYRGRKIKRCFFSDEMGIKLSEISKPKKHWMQEGMKLKNERIEEDIKLNCWGQFHGMEPLLCIFFPRILTTNCIKI